MSLPKHDAQIHIPGYNVARRDRANDARGGGVKIGITHVESSEPPFTYRDIKHMDIYRLYDNLRSIPWRNINDFNDINDKDDFFNENMLTLMDVHAPLRTLRFRKLHKPWITENIKIMIDLKNAALNKYKRKKRCEDWEYYTLLKNTLTTAIRKEKQAYIRHMSLRGSKCTWKAFSNLSLINKTKYAIPPHMKDVDHINHEFTNLVPSNQAKVQPKYEGIKPGISNVLKFHSQRE
nr:unnamed protein product [Callosobruchus analis]